MQTRVQTRAPGPTQPDAAELVEAIREGRPVISIDPAERDRSAAIRDAVLAALSDGRTRITRIGNALRTPLSLTRVLIQLGCADAEAVPASIGQLVVELMGRQGAREERILVTVDNADTLTPEAMDFLLSLPVTFAGKTPSVHLLLIGARIPAPAPAPAPGPAVASPNASPGPPDAPVVRRRVRLPHVVAWVTAGCAVLAALLLPRVSGTNTPPPPPLRTATADPAPRQAAPPPAAAPPVSAVAPALPPETPPAPEPKAPPPPAVASSSPAPDPTPAPTPGEAEQLAQLQQDFDRFLLAHGFTDTDLPPPQRQTLFDQFLVWRARTPVQPPSSRIVIYANPGSTSAREIVSRLNQTAEGGMVIETRAAGTAPGQPSVRYFFGEDAAAAARIADLLSGGRPGWRLRDLSAARSKPARGTIEVWVPASYTG